MFFKSKQEKERKRNLQLLIEDIAKTIYENHVDIEWIYFEFLCVRNKELIIHECGKPRGNNLAYCYESHGFTTPSNSPEFARELARRLNLQIRENNWEYEPNKETIQGYYLVPYKSDINVKREDLKRC